MQTRKTLTLFISIEQLIKPTITFFEQNIRKATDFIKLNNETTHIELFIGQIYCVIQRQAIQ